MTRTLILVALAGCANSTEQDWTPHARAVAAWHAGELPGPDWRAPPPYVPLRDEADRPHVTVYGYWPYWGDPVSTLPWDQLTHVAIFDVVLRADGTLGSTSNWTNNAPAAIAAAAPYGVKVHLCVTSFDDAVMNAVLSSPSVRAQAVNELATLMAAEGGHGVNVDFEGLDFALKDPFVQFIDELRAAVPEVYIAMPAVDWAGAYDFDLLALASDGLFIMGYDYHWAGGDPGPVAPLFGSPTWGQYSLDWSLTDYRTWGAPDASLVLGLPLYGRGWDTVDNNIPGQANGGSWAELYADAVVLGDQLGMAYDADSSTAYAFPSPTSQLWYDDASTLEAKIQFAVSEGIQGIGFWALTYEDNDADLWARVDALTHDGLSLGLPDPGLAAASNTVVVRGAAPGAQLGLVVGVNAGNTNVPGCGALTVDISNPIVLGQQVADAQGEASFTFDVPPAAAGKTGIFQAADRSACTVSNAVAFPFP